MSSEPAMLSELALPYKGVDKGYFQQLTCLMLHILVLGDVRLDLFRTPIPRDDKGKPLKVVVCMCHMGYIRCNGGFYPSSSYVGDVACCENSNTPCPRHHAKSHNDASEEWRLLHEKCPCHSQSSAFSIARGFRKCRTPDCPFICVYGQSGRSVFCIDCGEKRHGRKFEPIECIARPVRSMAQKGKNQMVALRLTHEIARSVPYICFDIAKIIASLALPDFSKTGGYDLFI